MHAACRRLSRRDSTPLRTLLRYNERVRIDAADVDATMRCSKRLRSGRIRAADDAADLLRVRHARHAVAASRAPSSTWWCSKSAWEAGSTRSMWSMPTSPSSPRVAIDHVDYLGTTREDIGREKAGIFRPALSRSAPTASRRRRLLAQAERDRRQAVAHRASTTISRLTTGSGVIGDPEARGTGCRSRRCAARINSPTRRAALAALDVLRDRLPIAHGCGSGRSRQRRASRPAAGSAWTAGDGARRRSQSGRLPPRWPTGLGVDGISSADMGGVRHHGRQGHRQRHRGTAAARGPLVRRKPAAAPRRDCCRTCACAWKRQASRQRPFETSADPASAHRAAREAVTEADRIIVFGSFLTVPRRWRRRIAALPEMSTLGSPEAHLSAC